MKQTTSIIEHIEASKLRSMLVSFCNQSQIKSSKWFGEELLEKMIPTRDSYLYRISIGRDLTFNDNVVRYTRDKSTPFLWIGERYTKYNISSKMLSDFGNPIIKSMILNDGMIKTRLIFDFYSKILQYSNSCFKVGFQLDFFTQTMEKLLSREARFNLFSPKFNEDFFKSS